MSSYGQESSDEPGEAEGAFVPHRQTIGRLSSRLIRKSKKGSKKTIEEALGAHGVTSSLGEEMVKVSSRSELREWRKEVAEGKVGAGTSVKFSRTFTWEDVEAFGHLTRDYNPVHYEIRFAQKKGFQGLICHGLLVGSMICEPGGQWAWLASGMNFRFLKPVYIGDTVTCELTITRVDEKGRAWAKALFMNQRGELVMEAELSGLLPSEDERAVLRQMILEGDPTNPLGKGLD